MKTRRMLVSLAVGLGAVSTVWGAAPSAAAPAERVTICHVAGLAQPNNANVVEITISANGLAGHFEENGTTAAGHEEDYLGPCETTPPPI